jgi:hypothetical protein
LRLEVLSPFSQTLLVLATRSLMSGHDNCCGGVQQGEKAGRKACSCTIFAPTLFSGPEPPGPGRGKSRADPFPAVAPILFVKCSTRVSGFRGKSARIDKSSPRCESRHPVDASVPALPF